MRLRPVPTAAAVLALGLTGLLPVAVQAAPTQELADPACSGAGSLSTPPEVSVRRSPSAVEFVATGADVTGVEWRLSAFTGPEDGWQTYTTPVELPGYDVALKLEYRAVRADGSRGPVLTVTESTVPTCVQARVVTARPVHGKPFVLDVGVTSSYPGATDGGPVQGRVGVSQDNINDERFDWAEVKNQKARLTVPSLGAGAQRLRITHAFDRRFAVTDTWITVHVAKAPSKVKVLASRPRTKGTVRVKVTSTRGVDVRGKATAKVTTVRKGKRVVVAKRTATVRRDGRATFTLPKKVRTKKGTYRVSVSYAGTTDVKRSSTKRTTTWRVR